MLIKATTVLSFPLVSPFLACLDAHDILHARSYSIILSLKLLMELDKKQAEHSIFYGTQRGKLFLYWQNIQISSLFWFVLPKLQ